jgi:hypothetical protein
VEADMSEKSTGRLHLADLVLAALLCGLILALFTSVRSPLDAGIIGTLIVADLSCWMIFRQRRQAPACED